MRKSGSRDRQTDRDSKWLDFNVLSTAESPQDEDRDRSRKTDRDRMRKTDRDRIDVLSTAEGHHRTRTETE